MNLSSLIKSPKKEFSFSDFPALFDLSPGYTRKIVADLVKKEVLKPFKDIKDKRKMVYKLDWSAIRGYLLSDPEDYEEIILEIVGTNYLGKYVAIDDFQVISVADDLMTLTRTLGVLQRDSTVFITNVGQPLHPLICEMS